MNNEQALLSHEVFQVVEDTADGPIVQGAYSRACRTEYMFKSATAARRSLWAGTYEDKEKYRVRRVIVTYTVVEEDCDREVSQ